MPAPTPAAEKETTYPKDRFDDLPAEPGRVGAHRAENPRLRIGAIVLWSVVATMAIIVVGVLVTLLSTGRLNVGPAPEATSAGEVVAPSIDTSHPVLVLNATDQADLGAQVRESVIDAGWAAADVGESNASSNDFPTTTVYYPTPEDEAAARGLADVIGGAEVSLDDTFQVVPPPAEEGGVSQLVVVVGLDFRTE